MNNYSRSGGLRTIKLTFVGHSIGNVIIRTALADSIMEPYLRFLYTYVSVSGPHLGYLYSSNSVFNSGLWLLKKLKSTQCIHQLTFTDGPELQNTFFFKLCQQKTLDNFRNIILLSSPQGNEADETEMSQAEYISTEGASDDGPYTSSFTALLYSLLKDDYFRTDNKDNDQHQLYRIDSEPEGFILILKLSLLLLNQRTKRSEIGQRRTRRPFSVTEVEALVHAVEKLGTGRWRHVKLCSFENAGHRTYVDLKVVAVKKLTAK